MRDTGEAEAGWGALMKTWFIAALSLPAGLALAQTAPYQIEGDGIPEPLAGTSAGNAARGKALLAARTAPCLDCHVIGDAGLPKGGDRGPALDGVGAVLPVPQLRLSVVDYAQIAKNKNMPSFHQAGEAAPRLSAQQVEDVVAYLASLKR
jgi:sulfur-oxidizing protein SoxX